MRWRVSVCGRWYQVMVLAAWFPSGAALWNRHECALSQVVSRPDMTLLDASMLNNNKQTNLLYKCSPTPIRSNPRRYRRPSPRPRDLEEGPNRYALECLIEVWRPSTISRRLPTSDNAHKWRLYNSAMPGHNAVGTMHKYLTQSHYPEQVVVASTNLISDISWVGIDNTKDD